jgi:hypothetical protein
MWGVGQYNIQLNFFHTVPTTEIRRPALKRWLTKLVNLRKITQQGVTIMSCQLYFPIIFIHLFNDVVNWEVYTASVTDEYGALLEW